MHELALAQRTVELMTQTATANGGGRIVSARLLLGELSCVQPETLAFAFDAASRGTCAEGCRLDIVRIPAKLRCLACGAVRGGDLLEMCPGCGRVGCDVLEGRELRLESVDLEEDTCPKAGGKP